MQIFEVKGNIHLASEVALLSASDFAELSSNSEFLFNWMPLRQEQVYKLTIIGRPEILGLVCVVDAGKDYQALKIEL